jgi:nucleotide-binding universal stress UspA family protein
MSADLARSEVVSNIRRAQPSSQASNGPVAFRNVLMATDFSKCSERALRYAIGIARRYGATLHLFHWVDPTAYRMVGEDAVQMACEAAWRDIQQLDTDLAVKGLLRSMEDKLIVEEGELSEILPRVIASHSIDAIVIGTHGRTGWRKMLLGSVAEKIFREVLCPVLTVGPNVVRSHVKDEGAHDILFPTDFSPQSRAAEAYAFSVATKYNGRLTLLRVVESQAKAREPECAERASAELESLAALHHRETGNTEFMVKIGPPADVILRAAGQKRADLIVLGVKARHAFADRLMWPNAYRIVCESLCPVLTVRTLANP